MLLVVESYTIVIRLLLIADLHEKIILSGNAGYTGGMIGISGGDDYGGGNFLYMRDMG